jgi:hypothetical protein
VTALTPDQNLPQTYLPTSARSSIVAATSKGKGLERSSEKVDASGWTPVLSLASLPARRRSEKRWVTGGCGRGDRSLYI